eukprot:Hpha_TRINITY_DN15964_c1_g2::TRINITY_DN15964_c1_g2_i1::g.73473::m.73473
MQRMPQPLDSVLSDSTRSPFIKVISSVMTAVVMETGDGIGTPFDARRLPTIPLYDYLRRWVRHTRCDVSCVVAAVMLIDRVCMLSGYPVTALNVHRLLLAALTVSNKYCLDIPFLNSHYARVGGVSVEELNALERQLLQLLEFDVHLEKEEFKCYVQMFRNHREWPIECSGDAMGVAATPRPASARHSVESSTVTNGLSDSGILSQTDRRQSDQTDRRSSAQTDRRSSEQTDRRSSAPTVDRRPSEPRSLSSQGMRRSAGALLPVPPRSRPPLTPSSRRNAEN